MYLLIKKIHVSLVLISIVLFYIRFIKVKLLNKADSVKYKNIPHVIDTFLLISAGMLCVIIGQYPFMVSWLTYKVALVIGYILFAMIAMRAADKKKAIFFLSISSVCIVMAAKYAVTKGQF